MVVVKITTDIPASRQIVVDLPPDTPLGPAQVEVQVRRVSEVYEFTVPPIDVDALPNYRDPVTGELRRVERSGVVREIRDRQ
jgi:hypothetical protein